MIFIIIIKNIIKTIKVCKNNYILFYINITCVLIINNNYSINNYCGYTTKKEKVSTISVDTINYLVSIKP